jgi:hypothetical protein
VAVAATKLRELNLRLSIALLSLAMPSTSSIFKTDEDAKVVHICTKDPAKTVQIVTSLDPK